jgi:hypothetical protein
MPIECNGKGATGVFGVACPGTAVAADDTGTMFSLPLVMKKSF